jgi:uncharacterized iron-regulated membrane protein
MAHRLFVWLHRWIGLAMTAFLIVVALTGSLLAFRSQLERLINPELFVTPQAGAVPLDLASLAERAEAIVPQARVGYFEAEPDQVMISMVPRQNPATGRPFELGFDHLFLDPYTGKELGRRHDGDLSQGRVNVMPFVYDLHSSLKLGSFGGWLLGIVALVWTFDCFVGFYLTLPRGQGGLWRRWRHAWWVKWRANSFRVNFDLHRAGGLWFWLLLLVFAWSSVMLALRPVYDFVTAAAFDYVSDTDLIQKALLPKPNEHPKLGWREAQAAGESLMAQQAAFRHFTVRRPYGLAYIPEFGVYTYSVRCSLDIRGNGWDTSVWVDADTGALRDVGLPSGLHTGNTVTTWLWALHYADVRDWLPYRMLVFAAGLVISMLAVTGVYIWWRKREARKKAALMRQR